MLEAGKDELFKTAAEIAVVQRAYEYLTNEHSFSERELDFLLKFQNPLGVVSDRWDAAAYDDTIVERILNDKKWITNELGYESARNDTESATKPLRAVAEGDGKASVLDRIRQAEKDAKERSSAPKDKSNHKKTGQEL